MRKLSDVQHSMLLHVARELLARNASSIHVYNRRTRSALERRGYLVRAEGGGWKLGEPIAATYMRQAMRDVLERGRGEKIRERSRLAARAARSAIFNEIDKEEFSDDDVLSLCRTYRAALAAQNADEIQARIVDATPVSEDEITAGLVAHRLHLS